MVTIERVESRAEIAEAMAYIVAECRAQVRRGYVGTQSARYAALHRNLDMLLESWIEADR